jgi:uncharacterized repeat protein (TIGR03803 family)
VIFMQPILAMENEKMSRAQESGGFVGRVASSRVFKRRSKAREIAQVLFEGLESRRLLTGYGFSTLTSLSKGTTGASPGSTLLADNSGDLFTTSTAGGSNSAGTLLELLSGQSTATVIGVFNTVNGSGPVGDMVIDSSGDIFGVTDAGGANSAGTLWEWSKSTGALNAVLSFSKATGDEPVGGLNIDGLGNIYGTTISGGASNSGTVYELPAGTSTLKTLAAFNGTDGSYPDARMYLDGSGNLWGVTQQGGAHGVGTIFEVKAGSGEVFDAFDFAGTNGSAPFGGLTPDGAGDLFGTTTGGGQQLVTKAAGSGTVFEFTPSSNPAVGGAFQDQAVFNGTDGSVPLGDLVMDGAGNLFGTAETGGGGLGDVFAVVKGSQVITEAQSFGGADGANPEFGLIYDSNGNLDGVTAQGGTTNDGTIFSMPPRADGSIQLGFLQQPSTTQNRGTIGPTVWVAVEDNNGDVVQSDNSTVTLSLANTAGGAASLGGTLTATAHNGVAMFNTASISTSILGTYKLTATDGTLTSATSNGFGVVGAGTITSADMNEITGTALDPSNLSAAVKVEVVITGGPTQTITTVANHEFFYTTPMLSVGAHAVSVYEIYSDNTHVLVGTTSVTSQNSLFDEHYYLATNPDVASAVAAGAFATGYDHYIQYGQFEGRSPSPYWNEAWYLQQNPDVAAAVKAKAVTSGFMHYYLYGQYQGRQGLLYFNSAYYLATYPDVASAVSAKTIASAYTHYVDYGEYEGRSPMLYFSSSYYDSHNSDILAAVTGEPLTSDFEQFVEYGQLEGRVASPFYNEATYLKDNPDVAAAVKSGVFPDGFIHWLEYGQYEGRTA